MKKKGTGLFFVMSNKEILGRLDYTRLNELFWCKRLWAKISKRYKKKYTDIKPFECEYK